MITITRLKDGETEVYPRCRVRRWCGRPVAFITSYSYPNAMKGGEESIRRTPCCEKHAQGFAERHGMSLPPGMVGESE